MQAATLKKVFGEFHRNIFGNIAWCCITDSLLHWIFLYIIEKRFYEKSQIKSTRRGDKTDPQNPIPRSFITKWSIQYTTHE